MGVGHGCSSGGADCVGCNQVAPPLPLRLCRAGTSQLTPHVQPAMPMPAINGAGDDGAGEGRKKKEEGEGCQAPPDPQNSPYDESVDNSGVLWRIAGFLGSMNSSSREEHGGTSQIEKARGKQVDPTSAGPPHPASSTGRMPPAVGGIKSDSGASSCHLTGMELITCPPPVLQHTCIYTTVLRITNHEA